jgi:hypothetical protein
MFFAAGKKLLKEVLGVAVVAICMILRRPGDTAPYLRLISGRAPCPQGADDLTRDWYYVISEKRGHYPSLIVLNLFPSLLTRERLGIYNNILEHYPP